MNSSSSGCSSSSCCCHSCGGAVRANVQVAATVVFFVQTLVNELLRVRSCPQMVTFFANH